MGIGTPELLIIAGIFVLLFGASRLPKIMRSMGQSVGEFKQGLADDPKDEKHLKSETPEETEKLEEEKAEV